MDRAPGPKVDARGEAFFYIPNPAMGLWSLASRFRDSRSG
jgi:hypothetical protein